jgi:glycosyltransferase involved in cell wall biosynthesis
LSKNLLGIKLLKNILGYIKDTGINNMKKIAIIAPPFTKIPPKGQGGTERIIDQTINGLISRGHKVVLFGVGSYSGKAEFIRIFNKTISERKFNPEKVELSRSLRLEMVYLSLVADRIIKKDNDFSLILNHARGGYSFLPWSKFIKTPIITVLHLPLFEELEDLISLYKNSNIVTVSNNQRKNNINYLATVYNGVELNKFKFNKNPDNDFLFMSALGEHKNPKDAILAIKKTKYNLIIAGGKKREPYFSKEIKPLIDGKKIKYIGEVSGKKRIDLLKNSKGFLFPIKWEEPFGLVMIEAMACGTPVISYSNGAVKEIIENNKTGFVVRNVKEMISAINKIETIDREKCRQSVESRFSLEKMIDGYESIIKNKSK